MTSGPPPINNNQWNINFKKLEFASNQQEFIYRSKNLKDCDIGPKVFIKPSIFGMTFSV